MPAGQGSYFREPASVLLLRSPQDLQLRLYSWKGRAARTFHVTVETFRNLLSPLFFLLTSETKAACPQLNLVNSEEDSYRDFLSLVVSLAFNGGDF